MNSKVRTIILVSLVTVLIWLWAEGESLSSETLSPTVVFVQDGSEELKLEPYERWTGNVRVRLQGSTRALTDARRDLSSQISLKLGDRGVPTQPGEQRIVDLVTAIQEKVRAQGLTVQEVTPPNTVVRIVKMVTREVLVRPALPTDVSLLGEATVFPQRVTVRMSESQSARLAPDAVATAELTRNDLANVGDDTAPTLTTLVRLPEALAGEEGIEITPPRVNVTFRLRRSVDSVTVATIPVWFSLPSTEGAGWDVELIDKFLRDVTFTGPTDAIAKIRSRESVPLAEVRLSSDDLENAVEAKEAVIVDLPAGVESGVAVKTVRLKVTRRKSEVGENPDELGIPDREPPSGG